MCSVICEIIKGAILYRLISGPKIKRGRKRASLFFQRARRASVLYQRPLLLYAGCWAASHTCAPPPPPLAKKVQMDRRPHIIVFLSLIHRPHAKNHRNKSDAICFERGRAAIVNGAFVTRTTWCQSVGFGAKKLRPGQRESRS